MVSVNRKRLILPDSKRQKHCVECNSWDARASPEKEKYQPGIELRQNNVFVELEQ